MRGVKALQRSARFFAARAAHAASRTSPTKFLGVKRGRDRQLRVDILKKAFSHSHPKFFFESDPYTRGGCSPTSPAVPSLLHARLSLLMQQRCDSQTGCHFTLSFQGTTRLTSTQTRLLRLKPVLRLVAKTQTSSVCLTTTM